MYQINPEIYNSKRNLDMELTKASSCFVAETAYHAHGNYVPH